MIAKIAVSAASFAIDKPYSYIIPTNMAVQSGMRVIVPFGRGNRQCEGIVLSTEEGNEDGLKQVALCMLYAYTGLFFSESEKNCFFRFRGLKLSVRCDMILLPHKSNKYL